MPISSMLTIEGLPSCIRLALAVVPPMSKEIMSGISQVQSQVHGGQHTGGRAGLQSEVGTPHLNFCAGHPTGGLHYVEFGGWRKLLRQASLKFIHVPLETGADVGDRCHSAGAFEFPELRRKLI